MTKHRNILFFLSFVSIAILIILVFHKKHSVHSSIIQSSPQIKTTPASTESNKIKTPSPNGSSTNNIPVSPYGNFISNHHPNISGNPFPSSEISTCITTINASCSITFRLGSITKTLKSQKVDKEGVATWVWDIQKEGFIAGEWSIIATSELNGKLSTTNDKNNLIVSR